MFWPARGSARWKALGCAAVLAAMVGACGEAAPTPIYVVRTPELPPTPIIIYTTLPSTPSPKVKLTPAPAVPPKIASQDVSDSGKDKCGGWTVKYKRPVVSGVAAAATMQGRIDARFAALVGDFKSNIPTAGAAAPCTFTGKFTATLVSASLLSIRIDVVESLGGASSKGVAASLNMKVSSGDAIALTGVFSDMPGALDILSAQSRSLLPAVPAMAGVGADWINPGTTPMLNNFDTAWAMSGAGLIVTFQELQVGPAACGTPSITVKWSVLHSVVDAAGPAAKLVH